MSSVRTIPTSRAQEVEMLVNEEAETVTLVSDRLEAEQSVPPTEWITISADVVIDTKEYR